MADCGFDTIEAIGSGGYGKVYKVQREGIYYALKVTNYGNLGTSLIEADILNKVKHENVMSAKIFFEKYKEGCKLCMLMPLANKTMEDMHAKLQKN